MLQPVFVIIFVQQELYQIHYKLCCLPSLRCQTQKTPLAALCDSGSEFSPHREVEQCRSKWSRKNSMLGVESHFKILLYLVNKSSFLPADANLINRIQIISSEYCKIHGNFALPCPPEILREKYATCVFNIFK